MKALRFALCGLALAGCASNATKEMGGTTGGIEDAGVKPSPNCPQGGGSMVETPDTHGGSYCIDQNLGPPMPLMRSGSIRIRARTSGRPPAGRSPRSAAAARTAAARRSSTITRLTISDSSSWTWGGPLEMPCGDTPSCDTPAPCNLSVWPVPASRQDYPVVNVSWCDAYAYCASHEKRLCGKVGGGALEVMTPKNGFAGLTDFVPSAANPDVSVVFQRGHPRRIAKVSLWRSCTTLLNARTRRIAGSSMTSPGSLTRLRASHRVRVASRACSTLWVTRPSS